MKSAKRKRLERAGCRLISTEEFLQLSEAEQRLVEVKLALADGQSAAKKTSAIAGRRRGTNEIEPVAIDED
jgi:hypothetical protein